MLGVSDTRVTLLVMASWAQVLGREKLNIDKLRLHKIVIMTDGGRRRRAQSARCCFTFFYSPDAELIEKANLYIARRPCTSVGAASLKSI